MRLSDRDRKCDLGSPVRDICTPGSERGDGYKAPCRLGEATASKGAALARLRKGYRAEACPYQPYGATSHRAREDRSSRVRRRGAVAPAIDSESIGPARRSAGRGHLALAQ